MSIMHPDVRNAPMMSAEKRSAFIEYPRLFNFRAVSKPFGSHYYSASRSSRVSVPPCGQSWLSDEPASTQEPAMSEP
ncbi:hypothetical protein Gmet_3603 [Geobacter metallireducens GS-15]|uniref:Uncharacterized protein n=1 Tax=Geobacter metallireducens (strain ATCC 53774 / DSM 7210 / GS-15) TaxID=269799 RepID=J9JEN2_GEOMG|nr:hypothetical protein Gmet_3603 [Geobacter metallireducens GS-15]